MGALHEMIVTARHDADGAGVEFTPIVNYPISWHIDATSSKKSP
jgi:hypothetical protein